MPCLLYPQQSAHNHNQREDWGKVDRLKTSSDWLVTGGFIFVLSGIFQQSDNPINMRWLSVGILESLRWVETAAVRMKFSDAVHGWMCQNIWIGHSSAGPVGTGMISNGTCGDSAAPWKRFCSTQGVLWQRQRSRALWQRLALRGGPGTATNGGEVKGLILSCATSIAPQEVLAELLFCLRTG